jgi:protein gp37
MAGISKIEWTDATWNPVRGCTKISPGCKHCYAETFAERFRSVPGHPYEHGFDLRLVPEKLLEPLRWPKAKRVFVNSMSDLFHEGVPERYLSAVVTVMEHAPWHIYQVLTKRSSRMRRILSLRPERAATTMESIWWGVSVEDRKYGLPRIEDLQQCPGRVRFLSIEPLLEDLGQIDLTGIDWVIVGGESGRGARPLKEEWVLSILEQCQTQAVSFFFKQWGGVHKKRWGRELGGQTYDAFPQVTRISVPDKVRRNQLLSELTRKFGFLSQIETGHALTL